MAENQGPKERLLEAASRLFYENGYNLTGINQILEESGVAKASLYSHYGSKDELAAAYLRNSSAHWLNKLEDFVNHQKDPVQRVLSCFDFLEASIRKRKFRGCRFINMMAEIDDVNNELYSEIVTHKSKLRKLIRRLTSEAGNDPLGDTVFLLYEGAVVESKIFKSTWPVSTAKRTVEMLLNKPDKKIKQ